MIAPRIHTNGDSKKDLQEALYDAWRAVRQAEEALKKTSPHARNYYVIDQTAFERARAEHVARVKKLEEVAAELMAISHAIDNNEIETIIKRGV